MQPPLPQSPIDHQPSLQQARGFWRVLLRDALLTASITWVVLLILEMLKPGLATNYLSLTKFAACLFILAIIYLSFCQPAMPAATAPRPFARRELAMLGVLSVVAAVVLAALMPGGIVLTGLLISVTVLAIWIGTFLYREL
ncbi:MAG: hypothetical protein HY461_00110 [Parcubacteria group bacterium]|nr:hypothetical protein [Parcubacteria group bacterium]